jgi:hypothetical protein
MSLRDDLTIKIEDLRIHASKRPSIEWADAILALKVNLGQFRLVGARGVEWQNVEATLSELEEK